VFLTEDAQRDLEELHEYITEFDSPANADSAPPLYKQVLTLTASRGGCGTLGLHVDMVIGGLAEERMTNENH
jgi:plasmid stabilization system protein ParE